MKRLAWLANLLFLATIVLTAAHAHPAGAAQDRGCVVCTVAHAPATPAATAPSARAPEPTPERAVELPAVSAPAPLCAVPSSRGPPRG